MDKKTVNPRFVFFLVLLIAVGVFMLYSRLTFTGYVTNVANATTGLVLSSHSFGSGDFSNTEVDTQGRVVLMSTKTSGSYVSQVFDAGQEVLWQEFVPLYTMHSSANYTEDPLNSSVVFQIRACSDSACTGKDFVPYVEGMELRGQYFQYRSVLQIFSGSESPKFSEVNVSHYPPNTPSVVIESPTSSTTYNNETVLIKVSSDNPAAVIWISNGTDNELYTAEFNKTYPEGTHTLQVFVSYLDGRINYTNSGSVTFTVGFLKTFYRYSSNACNAITLTQAQKTANDYATLAECQTHITTTTTTTTTTTETESQQQSCAPKWECFYNDTDGWSECVDGVQTRTCADASTCTTVADTSTRPPETKACTGGITTAATTEVVPVEQTATQEVVQDTSKKGFFSFVGSAIVGPVFKSTIGIIAVIVLAVAIAGFLVYRFFLKGKVKLNLPFKKKKRPFF